jgi:hypothetical protein
MLLYNITIAIDQSIESQWTDWMKSEHIPQVMQTGLFSGYRFYKVLTHEDPASASYCVQYLVESIEKFNEYLSTHATGFMEIHRKKYPDQHAAFQTLLEEVL